MNILKDSKANVLNLITENMLMLTDNPVIDFRGVWHIAITIFTRNFIRKLYELNSYFMKNESD